nr:unnamed protein product [Callosobruchus analis]
MGKNHISFLSLNIRSIFTGLNYFKTYIDSSDIDIITLTETWLNHQISSETVTLDKYKSLRADRGSRGGGVGVYIKKIINCRMILSNISDYLEQLWINVKLYDKSYVIGVVYRPPSSNISNCLTELEDTIVKLLPTSDNLLITGDLNINILVPDRKTRLLYSFMESFNLAQLVDTPTRITSTSQTLIDVVMATINEGITVTGTIDINGISDHLAVLFKLCVPKLKTHVRFKIYRDYQYFDHALFIEDLHRVNWDTIYSFDNGNDMLTFFNSKIVEIFNTHASLRTVRLTKPKAPWLTPTIRLMITEKEKAYKKFKRLKTSASWNYYKELRDYVNGAVKREKSAYLSYILKQKSSKETWNALRLLEILRNKPLTEIPPQFSDADLINQFFCNVPQLAKSSSQLEILKKYEIQNTANFTFSEVTSEVVQKYINRIKSHAVGLDYISLQMIRLVESYLLKYITFIFNTCISTSCFPNVWKQAKVIPFPKNNNPCDYSDLRPISILTTLPKVFEMLLQDQIKVFVQQRNIITSVQSGFRAHHSTVTALAHITDDIIKSIDKKLCVCLVLLDYSKAFDTLDHAILCSKLRYFGFSESSVSLIRNYLSDRKQGVLVGDKLSGPLVKTNGVPQGSVLGPLLFALYIADFHEFINYCNIHHYADDTQLYLSFPVSQKDNAVSRINLDMKTLYNVSVAHNLNLNSKKSQVIVFGPKSIRQKVATSMPITINSITLPIVDCVKNLGLWIDSDFRFTKHVNQLCQTSYNTLRQLYPSRHIMNTRLKLNICQSLVLSKIAYCDCIYFPALLQADVLRLQKIQNSCIRFACGIRKYDHLSKSYHDAGWLKLEKITKYHHLNVTHNVLINKMPLYLYSKLVTFSSNSNRATRNSSLFVIPKHSTSLFKRSFIYNAIKMYNSLPNDFRNFSIINFKKRLKLLLESDSRM